MSNAKAKQIRDLLQKPAKKRYDSLMYATPLHEEAARFKASVFHGLFVKANPKTVPPKGRKWIKPAYETAVEKFTRRFFDAYRRKDGTFFRALADVLECDNPNWSNRERFIYAQCSWALNQEGKLPSAGQLLRGWKVHCGIVPPDGSTELQSLWRAFHGTQPMPRKRGEVELALRPYLGKPDATRAAIQIVVIQREATRMGFKLPRQSNRNCLPAGIGIMP